MRYADRSSVSPPLELGVDASLAQRRRELMGVFDQSKQERQQSRPRTREKRESDLKSSPFRKPLDALFQGRCSFCERTTHALNLYRFRPVGNAEPVQDFATSHLYYLWLEDAWENQYVICNGCLPERPEYFPVSGRRVQLPDYNLIANYQDTLVGSWPDYPNGERSLLLDPCQDKQLWRSFMFRSTGEIIGLTDRGRITIQHFSLDRPELERTRRDALEAAVEATSARILRHAHTGVDTKLGHQGACDIFLREVMRRAAGPHARGSIDGQIMALAREGGDAVDKFYQAIREVDKGDYRASGKPLDLPVDQPITRLNGVTVHNFKSLESISFSLPETSAGDPASAMLILGENAAGKSTVLEAIALAAMTDQARDQLKLDFGKYVLDPSYMGKPDLAKPREAKVILNFEHNQKQVLEIGSGYAHPNDDGERWYLPVFAYGAYRQYRDTERRYSAHRHVRSLFEPHEPLSNPEGWLIRQKDDEFQMITRALRKVIELAAPFKRLKISGSSVHVITGGGDLEISTPLRDVSSGFRAILAMLCDILQGLMDKRVNPEFQSFETARGLVLIDEVEAHLHPKWKLSIMKGLREALPQVTFIATSHDPLCLRTMGQDEVMVLERISGKEADTELPFFTQSLVELPNNRNWTIEQLLTADFFQLRSTESLELEEQALRVEAKLANGIEPNNDPEVAEYMRSITDDLPIGHSEVHRLVQEAIAQFLREKRGVTAERLTMLKDKTRARILDALRSVG